MKYFRTPYTPGSPLVARVPFRFNGVSFMPGDAFPGDKITPESAPERRRRQMYDCRQLEVGEPVAAPEKEPTATDDAPAYGVKHKGFGLFNIIGPDGSVVAEGLNKNDAQAKADALNKPAGEREARMKGKAASAPLNPASGPTSPSAA